MASPCRAKRSSITVVQLGFLAAPQRTSWSGSQLLGFGWCVVVCGCWLSGAVEGVVGRVVGVRVLADPFVVAPPGWASIRTRLCVTDAEHDLLSKQAICWPGCGTGTWSVAGMEPNRAQGSFQSERRAEAAARKRVWQRSRRLG